VFHLDFLLLILGLSSMAMLVVRGGGTLTTGMCTKEILINSTVVVHILGQMVRFMTVSGLMICKTGEVHLLSPVEMVTLASGLMVRLMVGVPVNSVGSNLNQYFFHTVLILQCTI
jgi:hypothetical protein